MRRRTRASRRFKDYVKTKRKADIADKAGIWHYKYFNQLNKGKIHCSCPMCACKTNASLSRSRGAVTFYMVHTPGGEDYVRTYGCRIPTTNNRYGKKNYKISDRKKIDAMNSRMEGYECGELW